MDAPTTIGLPLIVIGPSFANYIKQGYSVDDSAMYAWEIGAGTTFLIGVLKLILAFASQVLRQKLHDAGKRGALAGIGFALLGLFQLTNLLIEPVSGLLSLFLLLLVLMHRVDPQNGDTWTIRLPFNFPGVLFSAIIGGALFYAMAFSHLTVTELPSTAAFAQYYVGLPRFVNFFTHFDVAFMTYISVAIPYAMLVVVGGMTVTDAAIEEGNDYSVRQVLIIDALCTACGAFLGASSQTTPYIGHTVYHRDFKAKSGYSMLSGLSVGIGAMTGLLSLLSQVLPRPAILPIFVFVAFEIGYDTFHPHRACQIEDRHAPAILFSMFPSVCQVIQILISQLYNGELMTSAIDPNGTATRTGLPLSTIQFCAVILMLAHGFIAIGLLWGNALAQMIDNNFIGSTVVLMVCSFLSLFGIIHSVDPNGQVYLPWKIAEQSWLPIHFAVGYFITALATLLLAKLKWINHFHPYKAHHHEDHHQQTNITPPHKKVRGVSPPPRGRQLGSAPAYGSLDTLSSSPSSQKQQPIQQSPEGKQQHNV